MDRILAALQRRLRRAILDRPRTTFRRHNSVMLFALRSPPSTLVLGCRRARSRYYLPQIAAVFGRRRPERAGHSLGLRG
jgi:hypothetical protein